MCGEHVHDHVQTCLACGAPVAEDTGKVVGETDLVAHHGCFETFGLQDIGQRGDEAATRSLLTALEGLTQLRDADNLTPSQRRLVRRTGLLTAAGLSSLTEGDRVAAGAG